MRSADSGGASRRAFCGSLVATSALAAWPGARLMASPFRDLPAIRRGGGTTVLPAAAVGELAGALRGEVLLPGAAGYDAARRVWNGMIDRRPALIVQPSGVADIVAAVQFADSHDLLLSIRGGGHGIAGTAVCEGGLMLDLAPLNGVRVNPAARRAFVQPGALLGAIDHESQLFGLATTAGTVSHTGAAGLTLGGGFGRLARRFGLACDNLSAADVVLADGRVLRASAEEHPDLLWGLRGGGGNFGVVANFEYDLHAVGPDVIGGNRVYAFAQAKQVLEFYGAFCERAPDDLCVDYAIVCPPGAQPLIITEVTYVGNPRRADRVLAPLRNFGQPRLDRIATARYAELQRGTDAGTAAGREYYLKSGFLKGIAPGLVDALLGGVEPSKSRALVITFQQLGGAIADVRQDGTAFAYRDATHALLLMAGWTNPADTPANMAWVRDYWQRVAAFTEGFYVNSYTAEEAGRVQANFRGNYRRLAELKRTYDAGNLFRMNVNIVPAA
ncbi:MAG: FAD-binding oxidoreductase [Gammaproteobacteria bacterium]